MNKSLLFSCFILAIVFTRTIPSYGQTSLPEEFRQETIPGQFKYLEEHTKIYEYYRAVREDIFQAISRNTIDTLRNAKRKIGSLVSDTTALGNRIDSLQGVLEASRNELDKMTSTKNSISVLGLEINKKAYNSVMWSIVGILVFLLAIGYLTFKVNRATTNRTKRDLNELKEEFEAYRTKTRLERERMTIDHFNEIKKMKGTR